MPDRERNLGRVLEERVKEVAAVSHEYWHAKRAELFINLVRPRKGARVLDLGGSAGSFMARVADRLEADVTVADISDGPLEAQRRYGFKPVILREDEPLPFGKGEFDVVFCNSVIEHVTLPKDECAQPLPEDEWRERSFEAQNAFASEIQRVGRSFFVQTPYRHFPVDAHTWLPLTNWLPHRAAHRLVEFTDRHWVKKCGVADWALLGYAEMRRLFPDARIHTEKVLGLPKSLIAYRDDR